MKTKEKPVIKNYYFWQGINKIHLYSLSTFKLACNSNIKAGGYTDEYTDKDVTCKKCKRYINTQKQ